MAKAKKRNAMRLLEAQGIAYETHAYDKRLRDARQVAAAVGFAADEVFKTLVVQAPPQAKPALVLLPANTRLNLKRLARALGAKKATLAPQAAAEKMTGLQVGGISPLALRHKNWPVYLDQRAAACAQIVISGGQRGLQLRVDRAGLVKLLGCRLVDVADELDG